MEQRITVRMRRESETGQRAGRLAATGLVTLAALLAMSSATPARADMVTPGDGVSMLITTLALGAAPAEPEPGALAASPKAAEAKDAKTLDAKGGHGLNSYQSVLGALMKGQAVTVTVDLATCRSEADGRAGPAVRGGMRIGSFLVTRDQTIAFSDTHETLHETATGSGEYEAVTEYLRYRLTPDGIVKLHVAKRGSMSDKPVKIKTTYRCQLGHGVNFMRTSR